MRNWEADLIKCDNELDVWGKREEGSKRHLQFLGHSTRRVIGSVLGI